MSDEWEQVEREWEEAERERADRFYRVLGLEEHARTNPIVRRFAAPYILGSVPLEEALAECVKALVATPWRDSLPWHPAQDVVGAMVSGVTAGERWYEWVTHDHDAGKWRTNHPDGIRSMFADADWFLLVKRPVELENKHMSDSGFWSTWAMDKLDEIKDRLRILADGSTVDGDADALVHVLMGLLENLKPAEVSVDSLLTLSLVEQFLDVQQATIHFFDLACTDYLHLFEFAPFVVVPDPYYEDVETYPLSSAEYTRAIEQGWVRHPETGEELKTDNAVRIGFRPTEAFHEFYIDFHRGDP